MVKRLKIAINLENAVEESLEILKLVRKDWNYDLVTCKIYESGITNKMLGFYEKGNPDNIVLIRINGNGTDKFLDRTAEVESFLLLHSHNCAPEIYCIFENGLCYEFIVGVTTTTSSVRDPQIYHLIIREMVKMHSIPLTESSKQPSTFKLMRKFLAIAKQNSPNESHLPTSYCELESEIDKLENQLTEIGSPIVFCHNDLLIHNIVFNQKKNKISFIDYEYASYNYQAFDIANHFCEYAVTATNCFIEGVDDPDYSLYPDEAFQMKWLRLYLIEQKKYLNDLSYANEESLKKETLKLYKKVYLFSMVPHLLWCLWALVQSNYSSINFDYIKYASTRLEEYFKRKNVVSADAI